MFQNFTLEILLKKIKSHKTSNVYFLIGNPASPISSIEAKKKYQKRKTCRWPWKISTFKF